MATIALHQLTDWPTFRHVRPLLQTLGVTQAALECWHYFYDGDAIDEGPFDRLKEVPGVADHEEALLAVSDALACSLSDLVGAADNVHVGFHWSASKEKLVAAATKAGHKVVFVSDRVAKKTLVEEYLPELYEKWELTSLRSMLKATLDPATAKVALRYIDEGGTLPKSVSPRKGADGAANIDFHWPLAHWTARHERILDVFVAATGGRTCPVWSPIAKGADPVADDAGRLRDALTARGVREQVILEALCRNPAPGSGRRFFGHEDWVSCAFLLAGWFVRLDEVVAMGPSQAVALFEAQIEFPNGLRILAGIVSDRWCRAGGFSKLNLNTLAACTFLDAHDAGEELEADAARIFRTRVLALPAPSMGALIDVHEDLEKAGPLKGKEKARFDAAMKTALKGEATLGDWQRAKDRELIDEPTFARGVVPAFRRAAESGFRTGEHGFGDNDGFLASAPAVSAADPDLCLRGFATLTERVNENGIKSNAKAWDSALPKKGFSKKAIAEAAAHFSKPSMRSTASILAKLLGARGIEVSTPKPPALAKIDATFEVGTDVAHLIVGAWGAVETVAALEDPDDWPAAIKKHKCVGLETGGDGSYTVRVVGAKPGTKPATVAKTHAKLAAHVATFPLAIKGDALTVSGIVGAGGTPTITFPSGAYAADVFARGADVLIVVTAPTAAPAWKHGKELPALNG